jgi:hypothetical protein
LPAKLILIPEIGFISPILPILSSETRHGKQVSFSLYRPKRPGLYIVLNLDSAHLQFHAPIDETPEMEDGSLCVFGKNARNSVFTAIFIYGTMKT